MGQMFFPQHAGGVLSLAPGRDGHLPLSIDVGNGQMVGPSSRVMAAWYPWDHWDLLLMMYRRHVGWLVSGIVRSGMLPGLALLDIGLFGLLGLLLVSQSLILAVHPFKPCVW